MRLLEGFGGASLPIWDVRFGIQLSIKFADEIKIQKFKSDNAFVPIGVTAEIRIR